MQDVVDIMRNIRTMPSTVRYVRVYIRALLKLPGPCRHAYTSKHNTGYCKIEKTEEYIGQERYANQNQ